MPTYSPEFKRQFVEKLLTQRKRKIEDICKEYGVSRSSAFRWLDEYAAVAAGVQRRSTLPKDWSLGAKMQALLETRNLSEAQLGVYLRKNGLYHCHLEEWKQEVLDHVGRSKKLNQIKEGSKESVLLQRVRELEKELKLKDKALREATALLALKKKAQSIWGDRKDEKSQESTEKNVSNSSTKPGKTDVE